MNIDVSSKQFLFVFIYLYRCINIKGDNNMSINNIKRPRPSGVMLPCKNLDNTSKDHPDNYSSWIDAWYNAVGEDAKFKHLITREFYDSKLYMGGHISVLYKNDGIWLDCIGIIPYEDNEIKDGKLFEIDSMLVLPYHIVKTAPKKNK